VNAPEISPKRARRVSAARSASPGRRSGTGRAPVSSPTDGHFGGEVQVTVVNLDVMVRHPSGRPVEGLTAADFRVLEDGAEMPISNFAAFAAGSAAPPAATGVRTGLGEPSPAPVATRRSVEVRVPAALLEDPGEQRVAVELRLAEGGARHEVAGGVLDRGTGVISTARARFDSPVSDTLR
jgi:hypothetical protein